jgi:hypothetical protein
VGRPVGTRLAVEVGATSRARVADLADGGEVDGVVESAVPALGQAVDRSSARGQLDGVGAVVGGEEEVKSLVSPIRVMLGSSEAGRRDRSPCLS